MENPKKSAGATKTPLHLLTPAFLREVAEAAADGARKYGPFNWRSTNIDIQTYIGATFRHLTAIMDGEDFDPVSGLNHWAHIGANVNLVLDSIARDCLEDNRDFGPQEEAQEEINNIWSQSIEARNAGLPKSYAEIAESWNCGAYREKK